MAFTKTTKRSIDLVVPSLGAVLVFGYFVYRKDDRNTRFLIMAMVITWVLLYVITTVTTKAILTAVEKPPVVPKTGDASSNINSVTGATTGFDTEGWVDRLKKDVYGSGLFSMSVRDADLYVAMAKFGNDDLISMWNLWNDKYFNEWGETMTEALVDEKPVIFSGVYNNMVLIIDRLRKLNCK